MLPQHSTQHTTQLWTVGCGPRPGHAYVMAQKPPHGFLVLRAPFARSGLLLWGAGQHTAALSSFTRHTAVVRRCVLLPLASDVCNGS